MSYKLEQDRINLWKGIKVGVLIMGIVYLLIWFWVNSQGK